MDSSEPKRRKTEAPDTNGGTAAATDETPTDINAVLAEHARQIEALAAANRSLDAKYQARVDELEAECREKCESLERKCGILETRCSSLERSIQVLKKDVNWTYSAPDIPRSHWIEQGHDEEYADNMEELLDTSKVTLRPLGGWGEDYYCECLTTGTARQSCMTMPCCPTSRNWQTPFKYQSGMGQSILIISSCIRLRSVSCFQRWREK